jgi:monooxygenase
MRAGAIIIPMTASAENLEDPPHRTERPGGAEHAGDGELREHVDVLIVGAGISGIGCAYYLQRHHPRRSYAILEARERIGGTWDLFRYPGIRSDSDLHTFGFEFKPWRSENAIADGAEILDYINEAASENGIDKRIRTGCRVTAAAWSSDEARWTVTVASTDTGEQSEITCSWLFTGTGYYHYDAGYTPELPGLGEFKGQIVHPQQWPEQLDYDGKRVVVIGSGATAVTLIPAMAQRTAQITMLQRSPSYIMSLPQKDPLANLANRILGPERGYALARRKNIALQTGFYKFCQRFPRQARALIRRLTARQLPEGYPVDEHFRPRYDPWDQRVCIVPGGDLFRAIRQGKAEIVTDTIAGFSATAIKLSSGRELEADIVVTATGLRLLPLGGIAFRVDGRPIELPSTLAYKGMMLSGIPNFVFLVGYTNASWTLKVGLVCEHFMRLLSHMDACGYDQVTPTPDPHALESTRPLLDFSAGYVTRSVGDFPRQGVSAPWQLAMNPNVDRAVLRRGPVDDPALRFSRRSAPSPPAMPTLAPEPPGPQLRDTPRWLSHIQRDVLGSFDALAEEFGDIAMVRLGPRRLIVFRSAEAARHILVSAQDRYPKAENFKLLRTVLGLGLVTSEGEVWRKSRRMVQPLFAKRHLGAYANHMSGAAAAALDRWLAG